MHADEVEDEWGFEHPAIRKLVNMMLLLMLKDEADELCIKPRNGVLAVWSDFLELVPLPMHTLPAILVRLKLMAEMDTDLVNEEQSGRFELTIGSQTYAFRVKTLPSDEGEGILVERSA